MNHEAIMAMTADITIAYFQNNPTPPDDVPGTIRSVFEALRDIDTPKAAPSAIPEPAVSAKASVKPDYVTCMECGFKGKMLKRHLMAEHGLTIEQYRQRRGLPDNHPVIAPNYAERRRELAINIGLGRK